MTDPERKTRAELVAQYKRKVDEIPASLEGYAQMPEDARTHIKDELFDLTWEIHKKDCEAHWLTWFGVR